MPSVDSMRQVAWPRSPTSTRSGRSPTSSRRRIASRGARWDIRCFANAHDYVLRPGDTATIYASAPVAALADTDHAADLVDYRRFGASATYCSFYEDCWQLPAR